MLSIELRSPSIHIFTPPSSHSSLSLSIYLPLSFACHSPRMSHALQRVTTHILQLRIERTHKLAHVCLFVCVACLRCLFYAKFPPSGQLVCVAHLPRSPSPSLPAKAAVKFQYLFTFFSSLCSDPQRDLEPASVPRPLPSLFILDSPNSQSQFRFQSLSRSGFYLLYSILLLFSFQFAKCVSETHDEASEKQPTN